MDTLVEMLDCQSVRATAIPKADFGWEIWSWGSHYSTSRYRGNKSRLGVWLEREHGPIKCGHTWALRVMLPQLFEQFLALVQYWRHEDPSSFRRTACATTDMSVSQNVVRWPAVIRPPGPVCEVTQEFTATRSPPVDAYPCALAAPPTNLSYEILRY